MSVTVTLPVKPLTKIWLVKNFGNPVRFPRRSNAREIFLSCLEKKFHPKRDYDQESFSETIEVVINCNDVSEHGISLRPAVQYFINRHFENQINNQILIFVFSKRQLGKTIASAVEEYQRAMNFTEEILSKQAILDRYKRKVKELEVSAITP